MDVSHVELNVCVQVGYLVWLALVDCCWSKGLVSSSHRLLFPGLSHPGFLRRTFSVNSPAKELQEHERNLRFCFGLAWHRDS